MHAEVATKTEEGIDADAALAALNDDRCRAILAATEDAALTAQEIADACDLPMSTAYRKLEPLTQASLLRERLRLRSDGNHVSEYSCASTSVRLGFRGDSLEVTLAD
ncbi:MAG: helix-turn-helix domain-containing protein [Haloferacaceae archaeon]